MFTNTVLYVVLFAFTYVTETGVVNHAIHGFEKLTFPGFGFIGMVLINSLGGVKRVYALFKKFLEDRGVKFNNDELLALIIMGSYSVTLCVINLFYYGLNWFWVVQDNFLTSDVQDLQGYVFIKPNESPIEALTGPLNVQDRNVKVESLRPQEVVVVNADFKHDTYEEALYHLVQDVRGLRTQKPVQVLVKFDHKEFFKWFSLQYERSKRQLVRVKATKLTYTTNHTSSPFIPVIFTNSCVTDSKVLDCNIEVRYEYTSFFEPSLKRSLIRRPYLKSQTFYVQNDVKNRLVTTAWYVFKFILKLILIERVVKIVKKIPDYKVLFEHVNEKIKRSETIAQTIFYIGLKEILKRVNDHFETVDSGLFVYSIRVYFNVVRACQIIEVVKIIVFDPVSVQTNFLLINVTYPVLICFLEYVFLIYSVKTVVAKSGYVSMWTGSYFYSSMADVFFNAVTGVRLLNVQHTLSRRTVTSIGEAFYRIISMVLPLGLDWALTDHIYRWYANLTGAINQDYYGRVTENQTVEGSVHTCNLHSILTLTNVSLYEGLTVLLIDMWCIVSATGAYMIRSVLLDQLV